MKTPLILAALLLTIPSCSSFKSLLTDPGREEFVEGNRFSGGPSINEVHGPDTKTMLESYDELSDELAALQQTYKECEAERNDYKQQLEGTAQQLDEKSNMVVSSELGIQRMREKNRNLESKVLSLSIENARLSQMVLTAQIDSLNLQLAEIGLGTVNANARPGGH